MDKTFVDNKMYRVGNNNIYQFLMLATIYLMYGTTEFVAIVLPFLELKPYASWIMQDTGVEHRGIIDWDLCKANNYTVITEETKKSIVNDFEIYCDKSETLLIGLMLYIGVFFGSIINPYFSDKIGRKKTIVLFGVLYILTCISFYLNQDNKLILKIGFFLIGVFYIIIVITSSILLSEVVRQEFLSIYFSIIYTAYSFFGIIFTMIFYLDIDWRMIFLIVAIIQTLCCCMFIFYFEESPRYYLMKRNVLLFQKALNSIARKNGKEMVELSEDEIDFFKNCPDFFLGDYKTINYNSIPENNTNSTNYSLTEGLNKNNNKNNLGKIVDKIVEDNNENADDQSNSLSNSNTNEGNSNNNSDDILMSNSKQIAVLETVDIIKHNNDELNLNNEDNIQEMNSIKIKKDKKKVKPINSTNSNFSSSNNDITVSQNTRHRNSNKSYNSVVSSKSKITAKSNDTVTAIPTPHRNQNKKLSLSNNTTVSEKTIQIIKHSIKHLVLYKSQRSNFLNLSYLWFISAMTFYGLSLNMKNFKSSIYLDAIIMFAIDIFVVISIGFITNTEMLGRKKTVLGLLFVSMISYFWAIFGEIKFDHGLVNTCIIIVREMYTCIFATLFYLSNEIYPTSVKSLGLSYNSAVGRLGSIISPLVIDYLSPLILWIFLSVMNLLAIVSISMVPETYNKPILEFCPEEEIEEDYYEDESFK